MKKTDYTIKGEGREIPVTEYLRGEGKLIIALHGFGGDRHSSVIRALAGKCPAVVCFDFPAHGDSTAPDSALTAENCIADFAAVLAHVREKYPEREVGYFATSFGGYILLCALHLVSENEKTVLRAPAVKMAETYRDVIASMPESELLAREYVICGFERKINVERDFYLSLKNRDAMLSRDRELLIIHGSRDTVVLPQHIDEFCRLHPSATLSVMESADHRFKEKGQVEEIISRAIAWFEL